MRTHPGVPSPFPLNGCVPLALMNVATRGRGRSDIALALAQKAARVRAPNHRLAFRVRDRYLFAIEDGSAWFRQAGERALWFSLFGLREFDVREFSRWSPGKDGVFVATPRPTLARFVLGRGARGRWIVGTAGHVVAVVNGVAYGSVRARARVQVAIRIEVLRDSPTLRRLDATPANVVPPV